MKKMKTALASPALVLLLEAAAFGQAAAQPTINNPPTDLPGTGVVSPTTVPPVSNADQSPGGTIGSNATLPQYDPYVNRVPWFSGDDVRNQLNLSTEQYDNLTTAHNRAWRAYNNGVNSLRTNLTPQQRMQQQRALSQRFYESMAPAVSDNIGDPIARQRYNQMFWQYRGYGAFQDPQVQKQLSLSPAQVQQFNQSGSDWNRQMTTWNRNYANQRQATTRSFNTFRDQQQQRIQSTLTADQRAVWNNLTGQPYQFQASNYFGSNSPTALNGPAGTGVTRGPNGGSQVGSGPGTSAAAPGGNVGAAGGATGAASGVGAAGVAGGAGAGVGAATGGAGGVSPGAGTAVGGAVGAGAAGAGAAGGAPK